MSTLMSHGHLALILGGAAYLATMNLMDKLVRYFPR